MIYLYVLLFLSSLLRAESSVFDSPYNHCRSNDITSFAILGERCSGTNFIQSLMQRNFPYLHEHKTDQVNSVVHKHYPPWVLFSNVENHSFFQKDHCLFIYVVRDPYDWLRSFYLQPFYVPNELHSSFRTFLSHEWFTYDDLAKTDNVNPKTSQRFNNILELRSTKIENYLKIGTLVNCFIVVSYDQAVSDPKGLIDYIALTYHLIKQDSFIPIESYRGKNNKKYKKKQYFSLDPQDLTFINQELDWEIEGLVGYFPRLVMDDN